MDADSPSSSWSPSNKTLLALTLVIGLTRIWAMAPAPWDWDEALFSLAVRDYDVRQHQPHPLGFPLFVGLAKVMSPLFNEEFRAVQAVTVIAAVGLFPAMFAFCTALGLAGSCGLVASLTLVFLPTVWLFSGTGFSDIPSLTLTLAALALIIRSPVNPRGFIGGSAVLALSMAIRPQAILCGMWPLLRGMIQMRRRPFLILAAALAGAFILLVSYGIAVAESGGWDAWSATARAHASYIRTVDSFHNPDRPELSSVASSFFEDHYGAGNSIDAILTFLALASLLRPRLLRPLLHAFLIFSPLALLSLLMLDVWSAKRFSIAYVPFFSIAISMGLSNLGWILSRIRPLAGRESIVCGILSLLTVASLIVRAFPAVRTARDTPSPPIAALQWVRARIAGSKGQLYITDGLGPISTYAVPELKPHYVEDEKVLSETPALDDSYLIAEGITEAPGATMFRRPIQRLGQMTRKKYFTVSVIPLTDIVHFGEGWYGAEDNGRDEWRWMSRSSRALLPGRWHNGEVQVEMALPSELQPRATTVQFLLNGQIVETFSPADRKFVRKFALHDVVTPAHILEIKTTGAVTPSSGGVSKDTRSLGLRLEKLDWIPKG